MDRPGLTVDRKDMRINMDLNESFLAGVFQTKAITRLKSRSGNNNSRQLEVRVMLEDEEIAVAFQDYFQVGVVKELEPRHEREIKKWEFRTTGTEALMVISIMKPYLVGGARNRVLKAMRSKGHPDALML